ncbi:MAG: hypothetical protein FWF73_00115 [Spirochaetes bacterium]|nr:hypothetical protein [Spirochaetota bacterium]
MREERSPLVQRQIDTNIYVDEIIDRIVTWNGKDVKDYKQADYENKMNNSRTTVGRNFEPIMTGKSITIRSGEKLSENPYTTDFVSIAIAITDDNRPDPRGYFLVSNYHHESDDTKRILKRYSDTRDLYCEQTLKLIFNPENGNDRKDLLTKIYSAIGGKHRFRNDPNLFDPKVPIREYTKTDEDLDEVLRISQHIQKEILPEYSLYYYSKTSEVMLSYNKKKSFPLPPYPYHESLSLIKNLPYLYTLTLKYYKHSYKDVNIIPAQGCLITCYADIITYYGNEQTPTDVDKRMDDMDRDYEAHKPGAKRGYAEDSADMMNKNVAEAYGFDYKHIPEELAEEKENYARRCLIINIYLKN